MKFVLHLKHWQLFLLTFAIPIILYVIFFTTMFMTVFASGGKFDGLPAISIVMLVLLGIAYITALVIGISWVYNLATGLYKKLPAGNNMKIKRFYFAFFYPMIYLFIFFLFMAGMAFTAFQTTQSVEGGIPPFFGIFFLIIPFHLLAMACMFYILYFIAKSLRSVELKREAEINEYIADFILIWFSFIGIWFIQPRVNQIFSDKPAPLPAGGPIDNM